MRTVFQMDAADDDWNKIDDTLEVVDSRDILKEEAAQAKASRPRIPTALPEGFVSTKEAVPVSASTPPRYGQIEEISETSETIEKGGKGKNLKRFDLSAVDLKTIRMKKKLPKIPLDEKVAIDLLPPSHKDLVDLRATRRRWITIFITAVIAAVLAPTVAFLISTQIQGQISAEQDRHAELELSIARYAEVNQTLESANEATRLLDKGASIEVDWNELIGDIESKLPEGTRVTAMQVIAGGKDTRTQEQKDDPAFDRPVATAILLSLESTTTIGYSDSLKAIESVNGTGSVTIGGLAESNGVYNYDVAFTYDISILTNRFTLEG